MLKKAVLLLCSVLLATSLLAGVAEVRQHSHTSKDSLVLVQKDMLTWGPLAGGAEGQFKFKMGKKNLDVKIKASGLQPLTNYSLIYFLDPWPSQGLVCLCNAKTDGGGNLRAKAKANVDVLPIPSDANYPCGAKIWLVLTADVDCENQVMTAWNPESYLFQTQLVQFGNDVGVREGPPEN